MSDARSPPELSMDEILAQIRRIIAEDEQPGATSTISGGAPIGGVTGSRTGGAAGVLDRGKAAETAADATDDILELTEAINDDGTVRHLAPIGGNSPMAQLREPAPIAARIEPPFAPELASEPPPPEAPSQPPAAEPATIPEPTAATEQRPVSAAAVSADPERPPGAAERTIEDIARELLRPVLQAWLDQHLPKIVERLVQAEIARMVKPGPG